MGGKCPRVADEAIQRRLASDKSRTQARGPRLVSTLDLRMKSTETEVSCAWARVSSAHAMSDSLGKWHYILP